MSATLPPTTEFDRPSNFGEFWQQPDSTQPIPSLAPEAPVPVPLSPEQRARQQRLRRVVSGVVAALLAFTAVAAGVQAVRHTHTAESLAVSAREPAAAAARNGAVSEPQLEASLPPVPKESAALKAASGLAFAENPVATDAALKAWSQEVEQLSLTDKHRAEQLLSQLSVKGARPAQEAARLGLAVLWRGESQRAKARTVFLSLARTASDPFVKKFALASLAARS